jgi:hypothetical protein
VSIALLDRNGLIGSWSSIARGLLQTAPRSRETMNDTRIGPVPPRRRERLTMSPKKSKSSRCGRTTIWLPVGDPISGGCRRQVRAAGGEHPVSAGLRRFRRSAPSPPDLAGCMYESCT